MPYCPICKSRISQNLDGTFDPICQECKSQQELQKLPDHIPAKKTKDGLYDDVFKPKFKGVNKNVTLDVLINNSTMDKYTLEQLNTPGEIQIKKIKDIDSSYPVYMLAVSKSMTSANKNIGFVLCICIFFILLASIPVLINIIFDLSSIALNIVSASLVFPTILSIIILVLALHKKYTQYLWIKLMTVGFYYCNSPVFDKKNAKWIERTEKPDVKIIRKGNHASLKLNSKTLANEIGYVEAEYMLKLLQWYFNTEKPLQ